MLDYKLKIGLIPDVRDLGDFATRKGIFEPAKGVEIKNKTVSYIKENFEDDQTEFYDLECLTSSECFTKIPTATRSVII